MPPTPILAITDGTTRISLHNNTGLYLRNWTPGRPADKKTRREPVYGGGGQVVINDQGNVIDTFEVGIRGYCQDHIITALQDVDRLLQKAINYWATSWAWEPVWLEAKGPDETNTRYAVIRDYAIDGMSNPYAQPFFTALGAGTMSALTMAIEHSPWQADEPGTATCTPLSHRKLVTAPAEAIDMPTAQTDDASTDSGGGGTIDTAGTELVMGADAAGDTRNAGIRFRSVAIPNGATILNAYIQFQCSTASAGATCNLRIYGELNATPAAFSTYANFTGRTRTTAYTDWSAVPAWVLATNYRTPNIAGAVQEIVNLVGWASGNDMVIFVQNNVSSASAFRTAASFDHATRPEPILHITYGSGTITAGIEAASATCLDSPHVTNHHNWEVYTNAEGITHAYTYDSSAATYSANLLTGALPHNLLPNPVGNNDCLYVGAVDTAILPTDDQNTFHNVVFNIATAATYGAGDSSSWQYWNGAAWTALTFYDETCSTKSSNATAFTATGVHSVHWELPSNWAPTLVNGINAYWVRCLITVAAGVTLATQQTQDIYTCRWACVDIAETAIGGDIPALARWMVHPRSDYKTTSPGNAMYSSIYMGLRSISGRDNDYEDNFSAYLCAASDQRATGITCLYYSPAGTTMAETADYRSPYAGLAAIWTTGAATSAMANILRIRQDFRTIRTRMDGTYHMFVRYRLASGSAGDILIGMHTGNAGAATAKQVIAQPTNVMEVADFGRVQLGPGIGRQGEETNALDIYIQAASTVAAARTLAIYDVIILPVDEWFAALTIDTQTGEVLDVNEFLDADSALTPKNRRLCIVRSYTASGTIYTIYWPWIRQSAGPNILQANTWQRMWFFSRQHTNAPTLTGRLLGTPHLCASLRCEATARYLSMRGSR